MRHVDCADEGQLTAGIGRRPQATCRRKQRPDAAHLVAQDLGLEVGQRLAGRGDDEHRASSWRSKTDTTISTIVEPS